MKKIFTLAAAASLVLVANAGTRVLYSQDFESITNPAEAGWSYGGKSMSVLGDEYGSYLQLFQGDVNGRNAQCTWGDEIYGENASIIEDGIYTVSFDFNPEQSSNNQYNSGITVLTNLVPPANQPFLGRWTYLKDADGNTIEDMSLYQGYLFDLTQVQRETESTTSIQFKVNGDEGNLITLTSDGWYNFTLEVNTVDRTVAYDIVNLDGTDVASGVREVPATECDGTEISMYATSLWVMVARYQTKFNFDNISVSCESSADVANTPSVALTGVGVNLDGELSLNTRVYTVSFMEGETLVVEGTDGNVTEVEWDECGGNYKYETTTSGTLTVYTTYGAAESEKVVTEVDASPCKLPEATAMIMSVTEGYGKTYRLEVDNKSVLLAPTIFITYKFVGDNGEIVEKANEGTGTTFTVTEPGVITITTAAYGYESTTCTVTNDVKYYAKFGVDFARMTPDDIKAAGFSGPDDLNTGNQSGENSWTGRKRLFYYDAATAHADEEGNTVYDAVYPFGFISEDDTEHVLHRWIMSYEDLTPEKAANTFPHTTIWSDQSDSKQLGAKMLERVGLIQDATKNNYNTVKVNGLAANDIVTFNTTNSYGANSCHPICNNDDEYFAQLCGEDASYVVANLGYGVLGNKDPGAYKIAEGVEVDENNVPLTEPETYTVGFQLYRIDTALVKYTVFGAGESGISNVVVDELKAVDNAWYTIDGIRMDTPNHSGLYIHQGKKVYIRK